EVDWADRVLEQVELVRRQDPSRTITLDVDPDAGPALADEGLAVGVLTNLLSNALKYAEGDGAVEVVVEADGDELITSVVDRGPGIPRSDRARVFDKFTRLGNHLTRSQQGVGLGLHIAKQSIERLDGRIWVDETPGGGATFRFTLPRAERARRRAPLRAPGSPRTRS